MAERLPQLAEGDERRPSIHRIVGKRGPLLRRNTSLWDVETAEYGRLRAEAARLPGGDWKRWGPYLSERQWGTVREDYSDNGSAWDYFPHDHARSRAYRWGEDGLLGFTDRKCRLCFCPTMWNGKDPIVKERLYGLNGNEGNHGEDVKELYYFLESTPTHSYMKALYKYPQAEYPYSKLVEENASRGRDVGEYEIEDTGVFDDNKYWDVQMEYAKGQPNDMLILITVTNRGPDSATLHVLPNLWFRNTWTWGSAHDEEASTPPRIHAAEGKEAGVVMSEHPSLGTFYFECTTEGGLEPELLFTNNETNSKALYDTEPDTPYTKDAFHRYLVHGEQGAVNPDRVGTKFGACYKLETKPGESRTLKFRLYSASEAEGRMEDALGPGFTSTLNARRAESKDFYASRLPRGLTPEETKLELQAYAGLLWSKQFYFYVVKEWLKGDPLQPSPPQKRRAGRNSDWGHTFNRDVISMPDSWEYPWTAAWDLAFHMIPFCVVDPMFAKQQLELLLREWYMHPNGQIPAYEWALDDVNPPVHAWSVLRVFKLSAPKGQRDYVFLASCFHKLSLNFTWWVNRKDPRGNHLFAGGFLGLDNIGVFDRSKPLPTGGHLEQADGTSWMGFYAVVMLEIALILAYRDPAYEGIASKFFEHFVQIADAMNRLGGTGLWDEEDGFYYDSLRTEDGETRLKVRSMVGLIPLFATLVIDPDVLVKLPSFAHRTGWFLSHETDLAEQVSSFTSMNDSTEDPEEGSDDNSANSDNSGGSDDSEDSEGTAGEAHHHHHRKLLLMIPSKERLKRVLAYLFDEDEFFGPYGIRSLSKVHDKQPFTISLCGEEHRVDYQPGESNSSLFGGNSNWRGPVWFPVNYMIIESLERLHYAFGDSFKVRVPTKTGPLMTLKEASVEISKRLAALFLPDETGKRPSNGPFPKYADDEHFKDLVLFYEYFNPESGRGVGASHQTGWTALITRCVDKVCNHRMQGQGGGKDKGKGKGKGEPPKAATPGPRYKKELERMGRK